MKRTILLMTICFMSVLMVAAQSNKTITMPKPDANTVYKDTAGAIISQASFEKMMNNGHGRLHAKTIMEGDKVKEVDIHLLTEEEMKKQQQQLMEMGKQAHKNLEDMKGKPAPDFEGTDLEGKQVKLSSLKGKVVVLKFWFTKCVPCLAEMPELNKMIEENYKGRTDVVFISLCLDDKKEIEKTLKTHPFSYRTLSDMMETANAYKVMAYPTHYVIDKDGNVVLATLAGSTDTLVDAITKALAK